MQIATITSSGKSVTHAEGVFAVDGETVAIGSLMDYDRLGMLTWASDETREWAHQLAHPTESQVATPVPRVASINSANWLRKVLTSPIKSRAVLGVLGVLVAVLVLPALFWGARDLMHPVTARAKGQLPTITSLVGQTERDARRMLGDVNEYNTPSTSTGIDGHATTTHFFEMSDIPSAEPPVKNSVSLTVDEVTGEVYLVGVSLSLPLGTYRDGTELLKGLGYGGQLSGEVSHNDLTGGLDAVCRLSDSASPLSALVSEMSPVRGQAPKSLWVTVDLSRTYVGETERPLSASDLAFTPSAAPAVVSEVAPSSPTEQPTPPSAPANQQNADGTSNAALSQAAIDYAEGLGGKSHRGETLYFIIGASGKPEDFMQMKLDDAQPLFGDMQSYFIVQKTDNFKGMTPGLFVVLEAYRTRADAQENLDFANRGFEDGKSSAYIKSAVVKTDDPIPVNYVDVNPK
jgi:hypothetical protein